MLGRDFLQVANRSIKGTHEADWRDAAGRAYYSLLLEGRDTLKRWGLAIPRRDQIHAYIRLKFIYSSEPDLKSIGMVLEKLLELRNHADYRIEQPGPWFSSSKSAATAINHAEMAITLLDLIDGDPVRRAVAIASLPP